MLSGKLTGQFVSFKEKTFKDKEGKEITWYQLTLLNPNTNTGVTQFTVSPEANHTEYEDLEPGQQVTVDFEYQEQLKSYTVTIDSKEKVLWITKPRLYIK